MSRTCFVCFTSWTRTIWAPCSALYILIAAVPITRSSAFATFVISPTKRFLDAAIYTERSYRAIYEQRHVSRDLIESWNLSHQLAVLIRILRESKSRIHDNIPSRCSQGHQGISSLSAIGRDFAYYVAILRHAVHRGRIASLMHQHDRDRALCEEGEHCRVVFTCRNIVD